MTASQINKEIDNSCWGGSQDQVYNIDDTGAKTRIIRARTNRRILEGKELSSGKWVVINNIQIG